jgi:SAM-dependent methyltransferase
MDRVTHIRTACADRYKEPGRHPYGDLKPYHINFCADMEARFGFEGKHVLEVGGSLNRNFVLNDLKVASWTGVHELGYWKTLDRDISTYMEVDFNSFEEMSPGSMRNYQIVTAPIERLPRQLYKKFDIVISMAAFSFLHQVGPALEKMYGALRPGGGAGIMCGQVWSSDPGPFFHTVQDSVGRPFSSYSTAGHRNPIPPWGHLLMTPPEMYAYLTRFMDSEAAGEVVYNTYASLRINRVFADDYNEYFALSPFGRRGKVESQMVQQDLPDLQLQKRLEARHPGKRNFNSRALFAYFQRLTDD